MAKEQGRASRIRPVALVLTLVVLTGVTPRSQALWDPESMPPGSPVKLTFNDGRRVTGRVLVARDEAVVLADIATGPEGIQSALECSVASGYTILRADVARVEVTSRPRREPESAASFDQLRMLVTGASMMSCGRCHVQQLAAAAGIGAAIGAGALTTWWSSAAKARSENA